MRLAELNVIPGLPKGYGISKSMMQIHRLPHHPVKNLKVILN